MKPHEILDRTPLGEAYLEGDLRQTPLRDEFRPSRREDVVELARLTAAERGELVARGLAAVQAGDVAYAVLAAGASTRMNVHTMPQAARELLDEALVKVPKSKALVPIGRCAGRVWTFLDVFFENVGRFSSATGSANPAVSLVSEANAREIRGAISARNAYGLGPDRILDFEQTLDRQIIATEADVERARANFASDRDVESAIEVSRSWAGCELDVPKPAGHGEFLHQLLSSGMLGDLLDRGIRYLSVRNIDNTGGILDAAWLAIFGRMLEERGEFFVEVSRRPDGPAGKGGALIVRPGGNLQLAEDPSFAGTGVVPRSSYFLSDAVAILDLGAILRIYEATADDVRRGGADRLREIAERGRRKFPSLVDVKPVRLSSGEVAGAFVRETNLWEATGVDPELRVGATGVLSVKDVEAVFGETPPEDQPALATSVRFVATKKWEDYEGINARLIPHVLNRIASGALL